MIENDQERQDIAKSEEQQLIKRVALYIAFHYVVPMLLILTIVLVIYSIFVLQSGSQIVGVNGDAALSWFSVAISMVIINFLLLVLLNGEAKATLKKIEKSSSDNYHELRSYIREKLSPSIHVLDGKTAIRQEAAVLLMGAQKEKVEQARFVAYFGAASLGPSPMEQQDFEERRVNVEGHPAMAFKDAFYKALLGDVQIDRYLQLFSFEAFENRSASQRSAYIRWLNKEIGLLNAQPSYTLWDSKRALSFGSTRSTIVTRLGFLDIIGTSEDDKLSGVLVRSAEIAQLIHERTVDFLGAADKPENLPKAFNKSLEEKMHWLENDYRKQVEDIHKTLLAKTAGGTGP